MKRFFTYFLLCAFCFIGTYHLKAQTTVPAMVASNQVWDKSGSPYLIEQKTTIANGVSVKIMPGVEVLTPNGTMLLLVEGELQGLGKADSIILIDALQIEINNKGLSYDSLTGVGAYFNYCKFTSPGVNKKILLVKDVSIRVENSSFINASTGLYLAQVSAVKSNVEVYNCQFIDVLGGSYPIASLGQYIDFYIRGNTFSSVGIDGGILCVGRKLQVSGNHIKGFGRVNFTFVDESKIECNTFSHVGNGVELRNFMADSSNTFEFTYNTLDSCGETGKFPSMMKFYSVDDKQIPHTSINYNNFLHYMGTNKKVDLRAHNKFVPTDARLNAKYNYWQSTDSSVIEDFIFDCADDTIWYGRADFSGALASLNNSCHTAPTAFEHPQSSVAGGLKIYPNPSKGDFNIEWHESPESPSTIEVYDMTGRMVYQSPTNEARQGTHHMNLTHLIDGIYLLKLNSGNESMVSRILIRR